MRYRLYRHLLKEAYVSNTSILFTLTWQKKICEKSYMRSVYVIFVLIFLFIVVFIFVHGTNAFVRFI